MNVSSRRSRWSRAKSLLMKPLNIKRGKTPRCRLAGQTISQPYMVARMTELLTLTPESRVLEIGTGSGYQTAILAHLVHHVCSVERIKSLQWQARRRLKQLDLHNVSTRHGDGWQGWQARAPFDAIIVTAAPPEIPTALLAQLDDDGVLVLPVGEEHQFLKRIRRRGNEFIIDTVEAVRFVPGEGGVGLRPGLFRVFLPDFRRRVDTFFSVPPGAAR